MSRVTVPSRRIITPRHHGTSSRRLVVSVPTQRSAGRIPGLRSFQIPHSRVARPVSYRRPVPVPMAALIQAQCLSVCEADSIDSRNHSISPGRSHKLTTKEKKYTLLLTHPTKTPSLSAATPHCANNLPFCEHCILTG